MLLNGMIAKSRALFWKQDLYLALLLVKLPPFMYRPIRKWSSVRVPVVASVFNAPSNVSLTVSPSNSPFVGIPLLQQEEEIYLNFPLII
jgi:hypothetical protein